MTATSATATGTAATATAGTISTTAAVAVISGRLVFGAAVVVVWLCCGDRLGYVRYKDNYW